MEQETHTSRRIWLLSDLHQEFVRDPRYGSHPLTAFDPALEAPADFDVVVLAGDVDVSLTRSIEWVASRFAGTSIIYVPGNHDFYNDTGDPPRTLEEIQAEGREAVARTGVHLLMDDAVELGGIHYIGGTLWTDFNLGSGSRSAHVAEAAGRNGMNDYRSIKRWSSKYPDKRKNVRPDDTIDAHHRTRAFIKTQLEKTKRPLANVVITHHAPLAQSLRPSQAMPWCYGSQIDELFGDGDGPALWLHGHIHAAVDYQHGNTRVVSNPRGYAFIGEPGFDQFNAGKVIEL